GGRALRTRLYSGTRPLPEPQSGVSALRVTILRDGSKSFIAADAAQMGAEGRCPFSPPNRLPPRTKTKLSKPSISFRSSSPRSLFSPSNLTARAAPGSSALLPQPTRKGDHTMNIQMIPLNRLIPSPANVRKTGTGMGVEELAASIAAHGLLQNLQVRP